MDFLPNNYNLELASFHTLEHLETLILNCHLDNREELINKLSRISESEASEMIQQMKEYELPPGRYRTPHTVYEQGVAIRNAVDLDDFYERNK